MTTATPRAARGGGSRARSSGRLLLLSLGIKAVVWTVRAAAQSMTALSGLNSVASALLLVAVVVIGYRTYIHVKQRRAVARAAQAHAQLRVHRRGAGAAAGAVLLDRGAAAVRQRRRLHAARAPRPRWSSARRRWRRRRPPIWRTCAAPADTARGAGRGTSSAPTRSSRWCRTRWCRRRRPARRAPAPKRAARWPRPGPWRHTPAPGVGARMGVVRGLRQPGGGARPGSHAPVGGGARAWRG